MIFFGGELSLVNLDVTESLDHTCMQYHKYNHEPKSKKKKTQLSLF